ncbi:replication-relaxation family protein [Micromonospora sp. NPDC005324]|uniref:replication-relaxation family protein n=1 Tax=Micromonospora sp. NPDC005324 TaxID=3157033 RepID=UPI0033B03101
MRKSQDRVLRVQAQLTDRDRLLLDWLSDHKVLTTFQISHALFGSLDFAQRRLLKLHQLGLVDRFRPLRAGGGSYPWHYVLDQIGAECVAATRDHTPPRAGQTVVRKRRLAASRTLDHLLGVNQFFTDLAGRARTAPQAQLERWWSEQRCAEPGAFDTTLLSPVRPDGHGVFSEGDRRVAFFAEFDSGLERPRVLLNKVSSYTVHAAMGGPAWPVLFWLPNTAQERALHDLLTGMRSPVPVATAARDSVPDGACAADAVWLVVGADDAPRRLLDLADLGEPAPDVDQIADLAWPTRIPTPSHPLTTHRPDDV